MDNSGRAESSAEDIAIKNEENKTTPPPQPIDTGFTAEDAGEGQDEAVPDLLSPISQAARALRLYNRRIKKGEDVAARTIDQVMEANRRQREADQEAKALAAQERDRKRIEAALKQQAEHQARADAGEFDLSRSTEDEDQHAEPSGDDEGDDSDGGSSGGDDHCQRSGDECEFELHREFSLDAERSIAPTTK